MVLYHEPSLGLFTFQVVIQIIELSYRSDKSKSILCHLSIIENTPLLDVRFEYCDIDSRCDMSGTVTQGLRYNFDIFDGDSRKISSYKPGSALPTEKIFGGRKVEIGEVPWQANLLYYSHLFCGAVIVTTTKVISAAHCFMEPDGSLTSVYPIRIIAGHSSKWSAKQTVGLKKFFLHP